MSVKVVEILKRVGEKLKDFLKGLLKYLFLALVIFIIICLLFIIMFFTFGTSYSKKYNGQCIEANEFGSRGNIIPAIPASEESGYLLNNKYKHETLTQKIIPTDLNLTLNGDPITVNIRGKWSPWLNNISDSDSINSDLQKNSFYSLDDKFLCSLEKTDTAKILNLGSGRYYYSNKKEENEFYYIKNYYSSISSKETDSISCDENGSVGTDGKCKSRFFYGNEEKPERQKNCWITRGAGLYMASFGISGNSEPSSYHHLIADKLICSKVDWFDGKVKDNNYVITKYKKPIRLNYNKCINIIDDKDEINCLKMISDGANLKNANVKKDDDRGLCLVVSDKGNNVYDCNEYSIENYTYEDFLKNYFDIKYHVNSLPSSYDDVIKDDGYQIIFNILKYEDDLIKNKVENYGYIIASSIEKFMNACYSLNKDIEGKVTRNYNSYFQYGPKKIYKNVSSLENVEYEYGEIIKMLIADKYYSDNSGYYRIDIISGINMDESGSIVSKLRELEYFFLGTPKPGFNDDRADGVVIKIFSNIIKSDFGVVVRIMLALFVVFYGYKIAMGFKDLKPGSDNQYENLIDSKFLLNSLVKIALLVVIISPNGVVYFNKFILNFFINGTIGSIDLISNIFNNSFFVNNDTLSAGLQNVNNTLSLSKNFALIDEISSFFTNDAIVAKIMSFMYNKDAYFILGFIISVMIFMLLAYYLFKILSVAMPFIIIILQLTLLLPLVPVFLLLFLFKKTDDFFKRWLNKVLSSCIELVVFFMAFYFYTSIINNIIKELLNFKVCFIGLGDILLPETSNSFQDLIKSMFNAFSGIQQVGMVNGFFLSYAIKIIISFMLIFMFDIMINTLLTLVSTIITIDGATSSGSKGMFGDSVSKGLDEQFKDVSSAYGIDELQSSSDSLKWTRNVFDVKKGITGNVKSMALKTGKALYGFSDAIISPIGDKDKTKSYREKVKEKLANWSKDTFINNTLGNKFFQDGNNILDSITGGMFDNLHKDTKDWNKNDKDSKSLDNNDSTENNNKNKDNSKKKETTKDSIRSSINEFEKVVKNELKNGIKIDKNYKSKLFDRNLANNINNKYSKFGKDVSEKFERVFKAMLKDKLRIKELEDEIKYIKNSSNNGNFERFIKSGNSVSDFYDKAIYKYLDDVIDSVYDNNSDNDEYLYRKVEELDNRIIENGYLLLKDDLDENGSVNILNNVTTDLLDLNADSIIDIDSKSILDICTKNIITSNRDDNS